MCQELLVLCCFVLFCWKTWQFNAPVSSAIFGTILQQWEPTLFPLVWHWRAAVFASLKRPAEGRQQLKKSEVWVYVLSLSSWIMGWMWQCIYYRPAAPFMSSALSNICGTRLVFLAALILFLKKRILSTQFLIESRCLISNVWSDLFLCFSLNEITANSLFIVSRQRPSCRKSWGFFLCKSFEILRFSLNIPISYDSVSNVVLEKYGVGWPEKIGYAIRYGNRFVTKVILLSSALASCWLKSLEALNVR